ncbi:hypothetical protein NN561_004336 [Cricetulus griseus]
MSDTSGMRGTLPLISTGPPAVDGCIHRAAGPLLTDECRTLHNCETGKAKITCGYRLPAKYVIHTVGPIAVGQPSASQAAELRSCYLSSLDLLLEHRLRSVVDRLIICVFLEKDEDIYRERLPHYFPVGMCPPFPPGPPRLAYPSPMALGGSHCPLPSSLRLLKPTLNGTGKQGLAQCGVATLH